MLTHKSEQFLISVLVQHESLHVCKNCDEPEILERAVHYNKTNFEGTIIHNYVFTSKSKKVDWKKMIFLIILVKKN